MILIRNAEVYTPDPAGRQDVLLAGTQVAQIGKNLALPAGIDVEEVDAGGLMLMPGLIDSHVHVAGAGGEGGPMTRTPELPLHRFVEAAVTTAIGCLGTDGITRNVETVLMKVKGLRQQGLSAWMYTGSYQVPPVSVTGDVARDLALIDEVIGLGEIALSDHRSSHPTITQLVQLMSQVRLGAMLGHKAGIINVHLGDDKNPFKPLYEASAQSNLSLKTFLPTHCNRNPWIFGDAKDYGRSGYVDITASAYPYFPDDEIKPSVAIAELLKAEVPVEHITMSSDAGGSLPAFDAEGNLIRMDIGYPKSLLVELADAILIEKIPPDIAIRVCTSNVAHVLKLSRKGRIAKGMDADLALFSADFELMHLFALGRWMVKNRVITC